MVKVYENHQFIILGSADKHETAYILYNKSKGFKDGHTHINNFKTAKWIMGLYLSRRLPLNLKSTYLLKSLIRISDDEAYTKKVQNLIDTRESKSHNYYVNVQKGTRKKKRKH